MLKPWTSNLHSGNKVCYCTFRATAACPLALFESLPTKGFIHLRSTTSSGTLLPLHAWKPIDVRESKGLIHNQPLTVHQHVWRIQNKNYQIASNTFVKQQHLNDALVKHSCAVISTVSSQQQSPGWGSTDQLGPLCGVWLFSPCWMASLWILLLMFKGLHDSLTGDS